MSSEHSDQSEAEPIHLSDHSKLGELQGDTYDLFVIETKMRQMVSEHLDAIQQTAKEDRSVLYRTSQSYDDLLGRVELLEQFARIVP
jgi:predicted transcriptional regulator